MAERADSGERARWSPGSDRGAMAIIIALMTLVFAGFAAFVVDVGALYEERRDLQNGADAAALAVAQACALNEITCPSSADAQPIAELFADANANDGQARTLESEITWDGNEVTVVARTDDAGPNSDGDTNTLDHWFARIWGNGGTEVSADASAAWGVPNSAAALPITFSVCEWDSMTSGGAGFPSAYSILYFHNNSGGGGGGGGNPSAGTCEFGPGQDIDGSGDRGPGGFGYLNIGSACQAEINAGGFVEGRTGNGNPEQVLQCDVNRILHHTLLVPIFDDLVDDSYCGMSPGNQNCYHIYGFAALYVEDVDWGSGPSHWRNRNNICPSSDSCFGGWFERYVSLEEGLDILGGGGGVDLGATVVVMTG